MKHPRNIVVKTLMNADEFVAFDRACSAEDIPHSRKLRDLTRAWVARRNSTDRRGGRGRTVTGQNMAMSFPGRSSFGASHLMRCHR
jgi:hypothetical protein